MAAGFPVKADYASGDVLTAAQMNDLSGTLNYLDPTAKGDLFPASSGTALTRLAVGANDTVLTADSSTATGLKWAAAAAASGGMTLISTTTLTGASITLSSIPQTYKNLQLVIRNFKPATDATGLRARINGDTGFNYNQQAYNSSSFLNAGFGSDQFFISENADDTNSESFAIVDFFDYANTVTWKIVNALSINNDSGSPTDFDLRRQTTLYGQTSAISSLVLYPASGNFTSGTALLYGVS
jgi:hypothetical protein